MSIPLIIVGAAGAALLFAGSKDKDTGVASQGASATPSNQSTGGADGGPQAPSHAGSEATNTVSDIQGAPTDVRQTANAGNPQVQPGDVAPDDSAIEDPWAQSSTPSVDTTKVQTDVDALKAVTQIGAVTGKAAAQSFTVVADALGAIW
jgi:hypothetical protein